MEDQTCPRCKTSKYRNPSLKLLVNVCGHTLCESCVEMLFVKGSGSCLECGVSLKRSGFRLQLFEDATVEKEVDIRKRILKEYNKKEEDFETLEEYNDYLEEVETIIYNLANNIDVQETNRRIEQYKRENKEAILRNKMKYNKEFLELERLIEEERQHELEKRQELEQEEAALKRRKLVEREALIDELTFSDTDARQILSYYAETKQQPVKREPKAAKPSHFSTGVRIGTAVEYAAVLEDAPLYVYKEPRYELDGPPCPEVLKPYLEHAKAETSEELAGGFRATLPCMRALQEAMAGLYNRPRKIEVA